MKPVIQQVYYIIWFNANAKIYKNEDVILSPLVQLKILDFEARNEAQTGSRSTWWTFKTQIIDLPFSSGLLK